MGTKKVLLVNRGAAAEVWPPPPAQMGNPNKPADASSPCVCAFSNTAPACLPRVPRVHPVCLPRAPRVCKQNPLCVYTPTLNATPKIDLYISTACGALCQGLRITAVVGVGTEDYGAGVGRD